LRSMGLFCRDVERGINADDWATPVGGNHGNEAAYDYNVNKHLPVLE